MEAMEYEEVGNSSHGLEWKRVPPSASRSRVAPGQVLPYRAKMSKPKVRPTSFLYPPVPALADHYGRPYYARLAYASAFETTLPATSVNRK